ELGKVREQIERQGRPWGGQGLAIAASRGAPAQRVFELLGDAFRVQVGIPDHAAVYKWVGDLSGGERQPFGGLIPEVDAAEKNGVTNIDVRYHGTLRKRGAGYGRAGQGLAGFGIEPRDD